MILYRLYTEDIMYIGDRNYTTVDIIEKCLDNFTLFRGKGYFEGTTENSLVIEYIGKDYEIGKIYELAREITRENGQLCVLVSQQEVFAELISETENKVL